MSKKMTGMQAVYQHLKTRKDGSYTSLKAIRNAVGTRHTQSAISNALYRLKNFGAVSRTKAGYYVVDTAKLLQYSQGNKFYGAYKPRDNKVTSKEVTKALPASDSDADILGNLLDAMARAERVIKKYQKAIKVLETIK